MCTFILFTLGHQHWPALHAHVQPRPCADLWVHSLVRLLLCFCAGRCNTTGIQCQAATTVLLCGVPLEKTATLHVPLITHAVCRQRILLHVIKCALASSIICSFGWVDSGLLTSIFNVMCGSAVVFLFVMSHFSWGTSAPFSVWTVFCCGRYNPVMSGALLLIQALQIGVIFTSARTTTCISHIIVEMALPYLYQSKVQVPAV